MYLNVLYVCLDSRENSIQGISQQQEVASIMSFNSTNSNNSQNSKLSGPLQPQPEQQQEMGANQPQQFGTKVIYTPAISDAT